MLAAVAAKPVRGQVKQAPETIPDSAVIGRLLDSAFATFKDGYPASQITSPMRARTDDPAEIAEIDHREVSAYRDEADAERHGKAIPPAERHQPFQDTRAYGADQAGHRPTPGNSFGGGVLASEYPVTVKAALLRLGLGGAPGDPEWG
jgi:hypothetical protein